MLIRPRPPWHGRASCGVHFPCPSAACQLDLPIPCSHKLPAGLLGCTGQQISNNNAGVPSFGQPLLRRCRQAAALGALYPLELERDHQSLPEALLQVCSINEVH